jgi:UDP-N-acetylmuramoyl-tripeptide--D-alanyl-D-alanine ligase
MASATPFMASVIARDLRRTVAGRRERTRASDRGLLRRHLTVGSASTTSRWDVDESGGVIFTAHEFAAATGGELVREGTPGSVCTDTRVVRSGQWFLALTGERFDGDAFAADALAAGCAGLVSSRPPPENWTAGYVRVENTLAALQALASDVRRRFEGPVVGITGSVGKTTVRDLCALALDEDQTHKTKGNLNNHVGLPLTILRTPPHARAWVLEMGMSAPGEIAALVAIARPNVRVVTNVAPAHLAGVGDVDGVARAKAEMFASAVDGDVCVLNADDARVMKMRLHRGSRSVSFGKLGSGADVEFLATGKDEEPVDRNAIFPLNAFRIRNKEETISVSLSEPGAHLAACAACAVAVAVSIGVPLVDAGKRISAFTSPEGRMRVTRGVASEITVLDDAYNASPKSVSNAFETLRVARDRGHRTVVLLGDMLELGSASHDLHVDALTQCLDFGFDVIGVAGAAFASAANRVAANRSDALRVVVAEDAEALWQKTRDSASIKGSVVLVKGSRGVGMERIARRLIGDS